MLRAPAGRQRQRGERLHREQLVRLARARATATATVRVRVGVRLCVLVRARVRVVLGFVWQVAEHPP